MIYCQVRADFEVREYRTDLAVAMGTSKYKITIQNVGYKLKRIIKSAQKYM